MFLGIESSCDETSLALLTKKNVVDSKLKLNFFDFINSFGIQNSIVSSQIDIHAQFGGVIPEIGARHHAQNIHWLFWSLLQQKSDKTYANQEAEEQRLSNEKNQTPSFYLSESQKKLASQIQEIFVTTEPGLISALRVGQEFAKSLQYQIQSQYHSNINITPVNHLRGHVASCFYNVSGEGLSVDAMNDNQVFPHLHLLVSGGNSQLLILNSWKDWQIVGQTVDDAAGETLDKIGRMLGLPYPGGVYISKIAKQITSNPRNYTIGMQRSDNLNYSFSGLKTAVRYDVQAQNIEDFAFEKPLQKHEIQQLIECDATNQSELNTKLRFIYQVCLSAQTVVMKQLVDKATKATQQFSPKSIGLSGGVSASPLLRSKMQTLADNLGNKFFLPHISLTGDNAVMIALAGIADKYDSNLSESS